MSATLEQLAIWMKDREGEHLEFKEAKKDFRFERLVKYCVTLANEGGGKIVLGVTDNHPRRVVGCEAFGNLTKLETDLLERIRCRIDAEELVHPDGRVLVFHVPSRPIGMPLQSEGAYWMRSGESLVPMTAEQLKAIFTEAGPDYSAEVCLEASQDDLDPEAIEEFRNRWIIHSKSETLSRLSREQLLADAELIDKQGIPYAALVLLGKRASLSRLLAQAEVIFEYRSTEAAGPANQRVEFREGFLLFYNKL